jgi:hypothetical protein
LALPVCARRSSATLLSGPVPARNADHDLLKNNIKNKDG